MNKELTLEEAVNIVDNMYQNRWKECGVEDGDTIHMDNLDNLQYNELESASILLLRTEIRLQKENKKLQKENEKLQHYKTLYQSLKKQKEELRSWLKEDKDKIKVYDTKNNKAVELGIVLGLGMCVEKLEELEQPKKELIKPSHYDENIDVEYELEKARKFIEEDKKRKFGDK